MCWKSYTLLNVRTSLLYNLHFLQNYKEVAPVPDQFASLPLSFSDLLPDQYDPQRSPALAKYWSQRYRLFSKFDEGIRMDTGTKYVRSICGAVRHHMTSAVQFTMIYTSVM